MTEPGWCNDWCDHGFIFGITERLAQGIAKIHAGCTPPCPRVTTAREYLAARRTGS
ncbi:hypothetical protein ACQP1O_42785 (plasmid) [Nocardia sp. CA-151230]|uniref:hypothetical protein n=1 Tax=Nocardia sp. CA-151230 TaxID=3239982 RepID=UPI003D8D2E70